MRRFVLLLVVVFALTALAGAQDFPRVEGFFGYSYQRAVIQGANAINMNGWAGELNLNATRSIGIVGSISGHYKTVNGANLNMYHFLFGPQFTYHSKDSKIQPYARALFGASRASAGFSGLSAQDTHFSWGGGAGIDVNINQHFGLRVFSADYIQTRFGGNAQNNARLSFGVKIH